MNAGRMVGVALGGLSLALFVGCMGSEPMPAETAEAAPVEVIEQGPSEAAQEGLEEALTDTAGQAAIDGEAAEESALLRIEIERAHTVAFYEPAPGGLYVAERMEVGQSFVLGHEELMDPLLAFERLRPGAPVPAELQAAYDRARSAAAARAGTPRAPCLFDRMRMATFVNNQNGCGWGARSSTCRVYWTGNYTAQFVANSGSCRVDHFEGDGLIVRRTWGTTTVQSPHGPGVNMTYPLGPSGPMMLRRLQVQNGAGDRYNVGCRWN